MSIVRVALTLAVAGALSLAAAAASWASVGIGNNAQRLALRVNESGYAEVSWTERGVRRTLVVPPRGRVLPGSRIAGPDVSRPAPSVRLPFARVVRQTPNAMYFALQAWRVVPGGPVKLHFSRWRGNPTEVTIRVEGERLLGEARFAGRGVYGFSPSPEGKRLRLTAYIDCFACPGAAGWKRLLGVRLRGPRGSFAVGIRPAWTGRRYRAIVQGPNRGWTYAPDASAIVAAPS